ncbi:hypothetical protein DPMN_022459 [Dreissena polymorpha]|uniref:Uncharacterized protein n=1 Tax=Dreissena polymorpha TaxID=45954 RepID=A0A9D3Y6C9_DREPO|nr:hypothetical protein DPMN_193148 [Dreissena polymorpha]KAH3700316.1 hypothetical protein DPMN_075291 [Dreissena polymorpha]KAH3781762.1 hypothetical protein DPMN_159666 [Dreissena polymorpha]KAH3814562.1 hypothetical protein DPMN_143064 [Dreissena polymorpha]KAH3824964.1 hypothetical protein DPMN_126824 [Dreissena polymorpha]
MCYTIGSLSSLCGIGLSSHPATSQSSQSETRQSILIVTNSSSWRASRPSSQPVTMSRCYPVMKL